MGGSGVLGACQLKPLPGNPGGDSQWPEPVRPGTAQGQWELASGCCAAVAELYPAPVTWPS